MTDYVITKRLIDLLRADMPGYYTGARSLPDSWSVDLSAVDQQRKAAADELERLEAIVNGRLWFWFDGRLIHGQGYPTREAAEAARKAKGG